MTVTREEFEELERRIAILEAAAALPAKIEKPQRGTRITDDFMPQRKTLDIMLQEFPQVVRDEWEREHRVFLDYWVAQPGQRGVKRDWDATWRNWMRKTFSSEKYQRRLTNGSGGLSTVDAKIANLKAKKGAPRAIAQN